MAEKIYYCKNCDKTFSSKSQYDDECPVCHAPVILTGMSSEDWRALTELDKPNVKKLFMQKYDEKYGVQSMKEETGTSQTPALDSKEYEELKRRVMQNKPSNNENRNSISRILILIGTIIMLIGLAFLIFFVITFDQDWDYLIRGIAAFVGFFISGIMFVGFGEIIRLLQILVDRS